MKLAFPLFLISTALGFGSVALASGQGLSLTVGTSPSSHIAPGTDVTLIDDDEDKDESVWFWSESDDDRDACEDANLGGDEGEDESDSTCAIGVTGNAANSGTVAPPQNGLFTDGIAPVVTTN